jgi:mannose/cellobiose epimerase-like protein (N-acyl-D-glucosamine 2-epimerase family)
MLPPAEPLVEARLAAQRGRLLEWLVESAYPLWAERGIDPLTHGFVEAIGPDGTPLPLPRRVRVQPRQIYAFSQASLFGWRGDVAGIVRGGLEHLVATYRRSDGFYRTLVGADGAVLDDSALLYDQAFVLLGLAAAATALDARLEMERRALELRAHIALAWRAGDGAFLSGEPASGLLESNPHMHLLEACLAWSEIGADPMWADWADEIANLALKRFINPATGALGEAFTTSWTPAPGLIGRTVEPGHQYEWAWLLLRCRRQNGAERTAAAMRLIETAETHGVRGGVAVNALLDDLSVQAPEARLWPQTERLKAGRLAAWLTGKSQYAEIAADAAAAIFRYLDTPVAGLWLDLRRADGSMERSVAYASTFYHLVGAIRMMDPALQRATPTN